VLEGQKTSGEPVSFPNVSLMVRRERDGVGRVIRSSGAKGQERGVGLLWKINSGIRREDLMVHPLEKHEEGVLNQ
jgi:hypothetical protein